MIVETHDKLFYRVIETGDPELSHLWFGVQVKRRKWRWEPKRKPRPVYDELVRKEGARLIKS